MVNDILADNSCKNLLILLLYAVQYAGDITLIYHLELHNRTNQ